MNSLKPLELYPATSIALRIFGIIFALFAVLMSAIPLLMMEENFDPVATVFSFFPLLFVLAGLAFATYRRRIVIDKINRTFTKSWGFIVFLSNKTETLPNIDYIYLRKETRGSGKNRKTVYPVAMASKDRMIELQAQTHEINARLFAEQIAKYLEVDMEDVSTGVVRRRKYADLDRSIKEQIQASGESVYQTQPPYESQVTLLEEMPDRVELKIPRGPWGIVIMIFAVIIFIFFAIFFVGSGFIGDVIQDPFTFDPEEFHNGYIDLIVPLLFMLPFFAIPFVIFLFGVFKFLPKKIKISGDEVQIKQGPFYLSRKSIPMDEVEELYSSKDCLYLIGDKKRLAIQTLLSKEDFDYLIQWIKYYVIYGSRGY